MIPIIAHLSPSAEVLEPLLKEDEEESKCRHDQSVSCVTKHHRKEEGKCDNGVGCWEGGGGGGGKRRKRKTGMERQGRRRREWRRKFQD